MRQIYTIGETVLDIVFKDLQPTVAKAGGSMLNTAVSLGRLSLPIHFISEYGTDQVGLMIDSFLVSNGVDTRYVYHYKDGKSALALAFLDEHNNADYSFYKAYPENRLDIQFPILQPDDILIFGSFYGVSQEIRDRLRSFLLYAQKQNAFIIYDPNFRKSHLFELNRLKPAILENISFANIVRCSNEDMEMIFGVSNDISAYKAIMPLCPNLIYTESSKAVYLHTAQVHKTFPVKKIDPISTIGAGDNFNAGLVHELFKQEIGKNSLGTLSTDDWKELVNSGIDFASEVCLSYDNYISVHFAKSKSK